jgi:hypothetical protein
LLALRNTPDFEKIPEASVREMFDLFGGSVRECLCHINVPDSDPVALANALAVQKLEMNEAIQICNPTLVIEYLASLNVLSDKLDTLSHSLLLIIPSDDFKSFSFSFCSKQVADRVFAMKSFEVLVSTYMLTLLVLLVSHQPTWFP